MLLSLGDCRLARTIDMTYNGKDNRPRKSSTNYRSLNNRITGIQREMSPHVMVSGKTLTSDKKQYVTRVYTGIVSMVNSTFDVKSNTNSLPDGCKILKVICKNLTGRTLKVTIPTETVLMDNGKAAAPFGPLTRFTTAPLSRFPVVKINIPDLLALPLDVDNIGALFSVGSLIPSQTDTVEISYTVQYAL